MSDEESPRAAEQGRWELEQEQSLPLETFLPQPMLGAAADRKTQVYRCRRCGARVADESDAVKIFGGDRQQVEFRRVRNICKDGTCYRCGLDLECARDCEEDTKLSLVHSGGKQAFVKTPYRVMLLLYCYESEFFRAISKVDPETGETLKDDKGYAAVTLIAEPSAISVINALRGSLFDELVPNLEVDVEVELRGVSDIFRVPSGLENEDKRKELYEQHYGPGTIKEITKTNDLDLEKTVDLCLLIRGEKRGFKELIWTGIWGRKSEKELAQCWRASGGNVLFGNWGFPEAAGGTIPDEKSFAAEMRGEITRFTEGVKPGRRIREIHGENEGPYEANNQLGLAELTERGHYLLWWPFEDHQIPKRIKEKIRTALVDGMYPRWQRLSELPSAFWEDQVGYYGWGFSSEPPAPQPRPAFSFGEPAFDDKEL